MKVGEFNKLIIECPYLIELTNTADSSIKIEGQTHLIEDFKYKIQDKVLTLDHDKANYIQHKNRPTIYIPASKLNFIEVNSIVSIFSRDTIIVNDLDITFNGRGSQSNSDILINANKLKLKLYGSEHIGNHQLKGRLSELSIVCEGATNILANELEAAVVGIIHRSYGDCNVNAMERLNVTIYSTGNTYYYGNPEINKTSVKTSALKASGKVYSL
ncbi:GIN domain-containing protein [Saccharicrinis aurantiacus]|uniref:GIN domain-containing protein n=1 Tax=Saccharicrinis aurantiacus TaxID=1849719 RepID=UPI002491B818|nr:DUF2807 domain-containing protein [Saccharicrinis aurantiacus]